ncbi:MAG: SAF domain-containing protein [Armatimonadota bacterium]|nr:SAF domain-containing protein [Armatimonadota bacterium]
MIIVDRALERREAAGDPIRVAMVGAGFMGRGIALQFLTAVPGMRLVAISNRHVDAARRAYETAGVVPRIVETDAELEDVIAHGQYAVTENPFLLCRARAVEAIIEVTGTVEFAAGVVVEAIRNKKHVILMNTELDGTLGPLLRVYAAKERVIITNADGDQPGVIMNLYRFVQGIGVRPILCGNIKGLHDPYRTPATQREFARKWSQTPGMVTAFADGTKISFEQAIVANATGMKVARRGMYGPTVPAGTAIQEAVRAYPLEKLVQGHGIVDYVVGAAPSPGVFVLGTHEHPVQKHYLELYKLGSGPVYCFYTPYHLCHFEVPNTVARAVIFGDAAIAPRGAPCVDVVATAKADLQAGQVLDGIGGFTIYGQCENADVARAERLLPMGLAEGCRLRRDVARDQVLTYDDVEVPAGRLCDRLRAEQDTMFPIRAGRTDVTAPLGARRVAME